MRADRPPASGACSRAVCATTMPASTRPRPQSGSRQGFRRATATRRRMRTAPPRRRGCRPPWPKDAASAAKDSTNGANAPSVMTHSERHPERAPQRRPVPGERHRGRELRGVHVPPAAEQRPERRREQRCPERDGHRRAPRNAALAGEEVERVRDGRREGGDHAEPVERAVPHLCDDREANYDGCDRPPQPRVHLLLEDQPRGERYEDHGGVLDEQGDAHGQARDRDGVEPLDHRHARDAERGEASRVAAADAKLNARGEEQDAPAMKRWTASA